MSIKVSVIIPIYNMEKWVGKAIETVEQQTLKDIEIICIDDGSTDNSLTHLKKYGSLYSNIRIFHQDNAGAGSARNTGIDHAHGEYIVFLDADDYYYSEDALEYLYTKAKESGMVICKGSSCDDRDGIINLNALRPGRAFTEDRVISKVDYPDPTGMWAGIYKREFLIKNNIRFPDLRRGQDSVFLAKAIAAAGKVYCLKKVIYVYRKEHKAVIFTEEKAVAAVTTMYEILRIATEYDLTTMYQTWRKELFGESVAMLYKYAAAGNEAMLELAHKLNAVIGGGLYEGDEIRKYVDKVRNSKQLFLEQLKMLDDVYVFGAGTVGRKVIVYLKNYAIIPKAVIVSDTNQNPKTLEGIPVRSIEEIKKEKKHVVIIATFSYIHESITNILRENGIKNIYPIDLCTYHLWQDEIIH